jgi:hypothetical protein
MVTVNRVRNSVLALGAAAFVGSMVFGAAVLPDRVASHFGPRGEANAWMSKEANLLYLGGVGLGLPLFILGLTYVTRFFPDSTFNLPHRDYWLAPERRKQTVDFLFHQSFWMAGLTQLFLSWVNFLAIIGNRQTPQRLSMPGLWIALVLFLVALGFWIASLIRYFDRPA